MPLKSALFLGLAAAIAIIAPATAHSIKELEGDLRERERYFQPQERTAPGFELQDAGGRPVRLADFRGKVVNAGWNLTHFALGRRS